MTSVTGKLKAWLPDYSHLRPEDLHNPEKMLDGVIFSMVDMRSSGWTHVGDASITVDVVLTPDQMIASKIETLRAQAAKIRADAHMEITRIEDKIQNLLAISYTVPEEL
jgi:hypothetical protein